MVEFFDTTRGLVLFEAKKTGKVLPKEQPGIKTDAIIKQPSYSLCVDLAPKEFKRKTLNYVKVALQNTSNEIYSSTYKNPIFIAYHWLDKNGRIIIQDGMRTKLPCDIYPNDKITFEIQVLAPDDTGDYVLEIDLVQELVCWFKERNNSLGVRIAINIIA